MLLISKSLTEYKAFAYSSFQFTASNKSILHQTVPHNLLIFAEDRVNKNNIRI